MSELLQSLSVEQLSLAFQVISQAENNSEVEVPPELENLSSEDWLKLDYLLNSLLKERELSSLH